MRRVLVVGAIAGVLAACGGGSSNGGAQGNSTVQVTGPIPGTLDRASAASATGQCTISTPVQVSLTFSAAVVGVASGTDLCGALQQAREPANATVATVILARTNVLGLAAPLAAGSYPVVAFDGTNPQALVSLIDQTTGNVQFAVVQASRNGASAGAGQGCVTAAESLATSGTVTVSSVTTPGGAIIGNVSATLQNGGTVSGSFNAPFCALQTGIDPATCIPTVPAATSCQ